MYLLLKHSNNREDPFGSILWAAAAITFLCPAFRAASVYFGSPDFRMAYTASHARMDALFGGVFIGYLYHYHSPVLDGLMRSRRNCIGMLAASAVFLSFAFFFSRDSRFFATFGYTFVWLAFVGVLLLTLHVHGVLPEKIGRIAQVAGDVAAYIGMYSYSIYLWHGPVGSWLPGFIRRALGFPTGTVGRFIVYFSGSFLVGIGMSKLIEYPILRVRDRVLPTPQIIPVATEVRLIPQISSNEAPLPWVAGEQPEH